MITPGEWEQIENRVFVKGTTFRVAVCDSNIADYSEEKENARAIAALPNLLAEHEAWAKDFGTALVLFLQGDSSAIDNLAHDLIIDYKNGEPILRSIALKQAKGE